MNTSKHHGFTLIELIVTITIIAIVMTGTLIYISNSVTAYTATARRDQLTTLGRTTLEKLTRDIRGALPNSLRVKNDCIEYFPTLGGSAYLSLPVDSAASSFTAVAFTITGSTSNASVIVYPYDTGALYAAANPGPLAGFSSQAGSPVSTVNLSATHQFSRQAPQKRFYVVGRPVSYCVVGNNLMRYRNYGIQAIQSSPPSGGNSELVAENIQTTDAATTVIPFTYTPGTLRRSGVVYIDLRFLIDGEWIRLANIVQVQNVL